MPPRKKGSTVKKQASDVAKVEKDDVNLVENEEKPAVPVEKGEKSGIRGSDRASEDAEDLKKTFEVDKNSIMFDLNADNPEYENEENFHMDFDGEGAGNDGFEMISDEDVIEDDDREEIEEVEYEREDDEGEEDHQDEHATYGDDERHEVVNEHHKRKEFEVFVGGLDKDATEGDLKKVFSQVGKITEVRLMMNPQTKKNKGFAFLRFATVEEAKRAVSELKTPVINGKQCGVSASQDNDTLFLGNINKSWTKEKLKDKLMEYKVVNIEDLNLVEDTNNKGMNRGFAFLEFSSRSDAMDAFRWLQKRDVFFGVERIPKVSFADSFIESDDEIMAQVKTVFIDGLPAVWTEDDIKECLDRFGEIEKIELARNMPSAKRNDFGFVTFSTHDAAVACAEGINNAELGKGDRKVKVRARLSRPHHRGRGKHGTRRDFRAREGPPFDYRPWGNRSEPRAFSSHGEKIHGIHTGSFRAHEFRRNDFRDRRSTMVPIRRVRLLTPERSYDRRPHGPPYPRSTSRREYVRRENLPVRSKPNLNYGSRVHIDRRNLYRDDYMPRGPAYSDEEPHTIYTTVPRRSYPDEAYGPRVAISSASYRERRPHNYVSLSGSKRTLDDSPTRYDDGYSSHSRVRLNYGIPGSSSRYGDDYGNERLARSHLGYDGRHDSFPDDGYHETFSSGHQGTSYGTGSSGPGVRGMYSSKIDGGYFSRRSDVRGSSYSPLYSGRNLSDGGYPGDNDSESYY